MIKLQNKDIALNFGFDVIGYQFPDIEHDRWDSNWCLVSVLLSQRGKKFEAVDACLNTYDLIVIQNWFRALSNNQLPHSASLHFTEPCLHFEFLDCNEDSIRIIIGLELEFKPDFKLTDCVVHDEGYKYQYEHEEEVNDWNMIFNLTAADFDHILSGLNKAIKKYPIRK